MALEKTETPGIYKVTGRKGVRYRLLVNVRNGSGWKIKCSTFGKYQDAIDAKAEIMKQQRNGELSAPKNDLVLYVIQRGADGPIKVGISRNLKSRLRTLQGANAEKLKGVARLSHDRCREGHPRKA